MIYSHVSVAIFLIFVIFLATLLLLLRCLSHFVLVLMLLDLLLLCNIILFVLASIYTGTSSGYVAAVLVLGVAAADTAVGLGLFILYFKATNLVSIKNKIGLGLWLYNVCAGCKIEIYLVNLGIRS